MIEGIAILIVFVVAIAVLLWKWLVLHADERTEAGYIVTGKHDALAGKEGVAYTPLRPSGAGLIDGRRVNVAAEGEFIERDRPNSGSSRLKATGSWYVRLRTPARGPSFEPVRFKRLKIQGEP
jgi:hypothetical protein